MDHDWKCTVGDDWIEAECLACSQMTRIDGTEGASAKSVVSLMTYQMAKAGACEPLRTEGRRLARSLMQFLQERDR